MVFGGIGMRTEPLEATGNWGLAVVNLIDDMPAKKAGVRRGDVVLRVDHIPTSDLREKEILTLIRGPIGKPVTGRAWVGP